MSVYKSASALITLSQAFKELLVTQFGIDPNKVHVVPGCVDASRFAIQMSQADARAHLGLPADRPIIVTIRRLVQRMGLQLLIEAVYHLRRTKPDVLLCIAGTGPLREALAKQITELQLENNVFLCGFVPEADLPAFYRAADLNVVPTVALEGFGLTTIEALAAGTPSMVTNVGGLPEIVRPLSPNLLFDNLTERHIAHKLEDALDGRLAMPSSAECIHYIQTNFNSQLSASRVADIYRSLV
jgi:glycosyltransferase involved in cell wall biosynthesis